MLAEKMGNLLIQEGVLTPAQLTACPTKYWESLKKTCV